MGAPWWRRVPGRLRAELAALRKQGIEYAHDRAEFSKGKLRLKLKFVCTGTAYDLEAEYPETYPYFAPDVFAPLHGFQFHQNPFSKNLCLLGGDEQWWTQWTLADLLTSQFPKLIQANTGDREHTAELEVDQGEPLGTYYETTPTAVVLVDESWVIPTGFQDGMLHMGFYEAHLQPQYSLMAVLEVQSRENEVLCRLPSKLTEKFKHKFWARWMRVPEFVTQRTAEAFEGEVSKQNRRMTKPRWGKEKCGKCFDITGIVFPEEVHREVLKDGWVFLLRIGEARPGHHPIPKVDVSKTLLVRAERAGLEALTARAPELRAAAQKSIAVVGLGCIGAPLALELARVGCPISVIDCDKVELCSAIRWPLGLSYVGLHKAYALKAFAEANWPLTSVESHITHIGNNWYSDQAALANADLVLDATADTATQRYLGDLCAVLSKPLILVAASRGGWGGRVARFLPDRTVSPCPACIWWYQHDGKLIAPPEQPGGLFQAEGCRDLTFQAANFDIGELSLAAARLAVSTLSESSEGGYPLTNWNVATLSLRSPAGVLIPPKWEVSQLPPHPQCRNHK